MLEREENRWVSELKSGETWDSACVHSLILYIHIYFFANDHNLTNASTKRADNVQTSLSQDREREKRKINAVESKELGGLEE